MKLAGAIADHTHAERRFQAAIHGVEMQDRKGHAVGRRMSSMERMKARRRGGHA